MGMRGIETKGSVRRGEDMMIDRCRTPAANFELPNANLPTRKHRHTVVIMSFLSLESKKNKNKWKKEFNQMSSRQKAEG